MVFFGATGDLVYKKIFRSLQAMLKRGSLNVPVISVAKAGWNLGSVKLLVLLENFTDWERWKEIRVDRLFAAKIVTRGESPGRPAHYLHS